MKKSKTAPATNERFAVVWNWESDMKILYIENTFDEARKVQEEVEAIP